MAAPPLALEPYATLRAEIDAGEDLLAVIDREKVTESTWTAAQAYWLKKMADEAETRRFETTTRYQALYVTKKKIFEGKRARKKSKDEQPKLVEPNVAALDAAASVLATRPEATVPAIVVPKPPVVEAPVAAPSFELPAPMARPPAPRIAEPARVGPTVAASALPDRTAPMQTAAAPAASLPFAPAAPNAPPPIARPAVVLPPGDSARSGGAPPASGRTANVDIDRLIRERKGGATPFPASKFESTVNVDLRALAAAAATPFAPSGPGANKGPASSPPPRRDSTPFAKAVVEAPLEDDDDAPKTMMLSEELAKAMSKDIPMSVRAPAAAALPPPSAPAPSVPAPSVPPSSRLEPSGDETLPVSAGIRAIRPPEGALPFQKTPFQKKPSSAEIPAVPASAPAPVATPNRSAPTLMGAVTPPAATHAQAQAASGQRIFSLNQFASLTAEIAVSPERIAETRQRYGVTEAQHKAESQRWTDEFAANAELRQRYFGLVQSYREYLQKQK